MNNTSGFLLNTRQASTPMNHFINWTHHDSQNYLSICSSIHIYSPTNSPRDSPSKLKTSVPFARRLDAQPIKRKTASSPVNARLIPLQEFNPVLNNTTVITQIIKETIWAFANNDEWYGMLTTIPALHQKSNYIWGLKIKKPWQTRTVTDANEGGESGNLRAERSWEWVKTWRKWSQGPPIPQVLRSFKSFLPLITLNPSHLMWLLNEGHAFLGDDSSRWVLPFW